jgi:hypothetical protein
MIALWLALKILEGAGETPPDPPASGSSGGWFPPPPKVDWERIERERLQARNNEALVLALII